jgi:hypothetical protein
MSHCSKCNLTFPESSRICRSCGAILEPTPDPSLPAAPFSDQAEAPNDVDPVEPAITEPALGVSKPEPTDWICPTCGETVPGNFELCWKCQSQEIAAVDRALAEGPSPPVEDNFMNAEAPDPPSPRCRACGSTKIIPHVHIADQGQYSGGSLSVTICGDPDAVFFKDRMWSKLTAHICGDCGHAELTVENPAKLYEHYRRSLQ